MSASKTSFNETFVYYAWTRDRRHDGYLSLYMCEYTRYKLKGKFSYTRLNTPERNTIFETNMMMKLL